MDKLKAKSVDEIRALRLSKLESYADSNYLRTLLVKMSDDSEGKGGTSTFISSITLDESTTIRKIEVVFHSNENFIWKMSFYNETGLFLELGVLTANGRKETFDLAANERLIGFELDHGSNNLIGITFLKWTI